MGYLGGIIGGLVGGLVGALIWALIVGFGNWEIGWIAWGIGFLVGVGSNMGSKNQGGLLHGALAVVVALGCLLAGKLGGEAIAFNKYMSQNPADFEVTEEYVISFVADDVAEEMEAAGEPVQWPSHMQDLEAVPEAQADYPAEVWAEAQRRWDGWSEDERRYYREQAEFSVENVGLIAAYSTYANLSPWDILWAALCLGTAGRITYAGTHEE